MKKHCHNNAVWDGLCKFTWSYVLQSNTSCIPKNLIFDKKGYVKCTKQNDIIYEKIFYRVVCKNVVSQKLHQRLSFTTVMAWNVDYYLSKPM